MNKVFVGILAVCLCISTAFAEERFGNVMSDRADLHYVLLVETVPKKLYLLEVSADSYSVIDSTDILTGRSDGSKTIQDDGKTPEGIYYFVNYMTDEQMYKRFGDIAYRYGIAALPSNYPNPVDRIMKRTGYGIWLHGLAPDRHKPATEGCVAMQNTSMERMLPYLSVGMPMVIVGEASLLPEAAYNEQREAYLSTFHDFINAWRSSDYDAFKGFIHPKYKSYAAASADSYLSQKQNLMKHYPERYIEISNINIYSQNGKMMVYDYDQFYCADNLLSYGNKRLYMLPDEGVNKVISEEMQPLPLNNYLRPHIDGFISEWASAWESQDIDAYMSFYGSDFPERASWESRKQLLFDGGSLSVSVSDLKYELKGAKIHISFQQIYESDRNSDKGIKTLIISGCPGSYKIISESWRRL